ncbi:MAG: hypothetical protein LBI61_01870 [Puniceicoccales bacterium]|jgi:hypothetical protein|nr:hypothetical protein [Puniceicoccales bacterium]
MAFFSKKHSGSILLFVLISIAILGVAAVMFLNGGVHKKAFYTDAAREHGFSDANQDLHGSELVKIEAESMRNFVFGAIRTRHLGGNKLFEANQASKQDIVLRDNNFTAAMTWVAQQKPDHNLGMIVDYANIDIFPLDNKIPFTQKFTNEVREAIRVAFNTFEVGQNSINKITDDLLNSEAKSVDDFKNLNAWKKVFRNNQDAEQNVIKLLKESLCFSEDVEAVNFFMANDLVKFALCKCFEPDAPSGNKFNFAADGHLMQNPNNTQLLIEMSEAASPIEKLKAARVQPAERRLLRAQQAAQNAQTAAANRAVVEAQQKLIAAQQPQLDDVFKIGKDDKVLLWNNNGTPTSYSRMIGVTVNAKDMKYKYLTSEQTYTCKLPKCGVFAEPKE